MSSSDIPESDIIEAALIPSFDDDSESELSGSPLSDSPCGLKYDFTMSVHFHGNFLTLGYHKVSQF